METNNAFNYELRELARELISSEFDQFDANPVEYIKSLGFSKEWSSIAVIVKGQLAFTSEDIDKLCVIMQGLGTEDTIEIAENGKVHDYLNNLLSGYITGKRSSLPKKQGHSHMEQKLATIAVYPAPDEPIASLEMSPCKEVGENNVERCEEDEAEFWSIYARDTKGFAQCIFDCTDKQATENMLALLEGVAKNFAK